MLSLGFDTGLLGADGAPVYHDHGGCSEDQRLEATVNQAELRQMANERIKDAEALIDGKRWEFAYYAAGYAVECALKSCVLARMIYTGWVFDDDVKKKVDDCRTHEFLKLIQIAGLWDELNNALKTSLAAGDEFVGNWDTVNLQRHDTGLKELLVLVGSAMVAQSTRWT